MRLSSQSGRSLGWSKAAPWVLFVLALGGPAHAGLFDDDEARRAILDLRAAGKVTDQRITDETAALRQQNATLQRAVLDLQNQIDALKADQATLRGQNEQLARDLSVVQQRQKDLTQGLDDRLAKIEPTKVTVDGMTFTADPAEKKDFEAALSTFQSSDFAGAQSAFAAFMRRYPSSGYNPSALFWLGNAQYATHNYKEAILNFKAMLAAVPNHARAPEAMLSIANCQIELRDNRSARATLESLQKTYPQSEAAVAAKDRLATLR